MGYGLRKSPIAERVNKQNIQVSCLSHDKYLKLQLKKLKKKSFPLWAKNTHGSKCSPQYNEVFYPNMIGVNLKAP